MYKLRDYQQDAVDATLNHFKKTLDPAVIVLPTGAGKSLVIASLALKARGRVLVLAHVKELVEQNHEKYESYGASAGIFSAGLGRKDSREKVIFSSIQSVAHADSSFFDGFTLVVIDECHRVSMESDTQYRKVIESLQNTGERVCILGLTATPYRLSTGWLYQFHYRGEMRSQEPKFFKKCIYELSLSYMIKNGYLTPPIQIDSPVACYDFDSLLERTEGRVIRPEDLEESLRDQKRITPSIMKNIVDLSQDREGVMIFTSTIKHAIEILDYMPKDQTRVVIGDTPSSEREEVISDFKARKVKYLINVSVLTTGFDAPHVDLIAILRPTKSVGLYQQIVGRGLRLSPGKEDCLVLDYTGLNYDIFKPIIDEKKPTEESVPVEVPCPKCGLVNNFWGLKDEEGLVVEHFGRKCLGASEGLDGEINYCGYLFRFKLCDSCLLENDISASQCVHCDHQLRDPDKILKEAMSLKDAHVMKPDTMLFECDFDKKKRERLKITYYDLDANELSEYFYLDSKSSLTAFDLTFTRMHLRRPELSLKFSSIEEVIEKQVLLRMPAFVVARLKGRYWQIREKIFRS
jgi:DNA repair protein RadD